MVRAWFVGMSWAVMMGFGARGGEPPFARHVVVSQEGHASDVGRESLRQGGNAVDAAVATAFALAVTLPEAGNLGGGGFIVAFDARTGKVATFDFRETAPASSSPRMYLGEDGKPKPRFRAGAWAAGTPGTVRGLAMAHQRLGKRPWAELVRPAARLAREGFEISADLARSLNRQLDPAATTRKAGGRDDFGRLADFPESRAAFSRPDHAPWKAGDRLVQADLAQTLERIAAGGGDEFYTGRTAQLIASYMKNHGGFVTLEDLRAYEAKMRPSVHTTYRGHEIHGVGPASSGGVVICLALNILEGFDLKADGPTAPRTLHRVAEAMRRGFFTRAMLLGDPDFVSIPTSELVSKPYARKLAQSIGDRATKSQDLAPFQVLPAESDHTTHFSVLDSQGDAVAMTYTLEDSYGAKCVVEGAGFLLNNEMGDFNVVPGRTDVAGLIGTPPNRIAPGKRMLSSMSPTLVLKDGRVRMVTGSPGGRTIPNTTLWVVLNVLDFGMDARRAVDAPRTHHQWFPDRLSLEGRSWPAETLAALAALGHETRLTAHQGVANTIVVSPDGRAIEGAADHRREPAKASGD